MSVEDCVDWVGENQRKCAWISFFVVVLVSLSISMFAASFSILEPTFIGLDINEFTQEVDYGHVWRHGRHFLGLGHSFIRYDTKLQTVSFDKMAVWTREGQHVDIDLSFQYRIDDSAQALKVLWEKTKGTHGSLVTSVARSTVKNVCVTFLSTDYFINRPNMSEAFAGNLSERFAELFSPPAISISGVQFKRVDLPDPFEDKLVSKVVAAQLKKTAEIHMQVANVTSETRVLLGEANANITLILANARAGAIQLLADAEAEGVTLVAAAEEAGLSALAASLGLQRNGTRLDGAAGSVQESLNFFYLSLIGKQGPNADYAIGVSSLTGVA